MIEIRISKQRKCLVEYPNCIFTQFFCKKKCPQMQYWIEKERKYVVSVISSQKVSIICCEW